jgi:hypothetical protein
MTEGTARPDDRYHVDFPIHISWQDGAGQIRSAAARCRDLSASGLHAETKDPFTPHTLVLVQSGIFGRMGNASVRYCRREGMKYAVGLHFSSSFELSDPVRKKLLERVLAD